MKKNIVKKIDDALFEFYLNADDDIIDSSLKEDVTDMEIFRAKTDKMAKKLIFIAKAIDNKEKDQHLLQIAAKFQKAIENNIERPIAIFKQLITGTPAYYRNLNQLTKEDIIEIIKDKNLVELLEKLENGDSK